MGCKDLLDRIESGHDKDCLTMHAYMSACDFLLPVPVIVVCPLIYEIDSSGQGQEILSAAPLRQMQLIKILSHIVSPEDHCLSPLLVCLLDCQWIYRTLPGIYGRSEEDCDFLPFYRSLQLNAIFQGNDS